jgi:hypothetical protein
MSFIFIFPFLIIFAVFLILFLKSKKQVYLISTVITAGILGWSLIFGVLSSLFPQDYKIQKQSVLATCDNSGKIYSATYWTDSQEYKKSFIYYQKDAKIIDLNNSLSRSLIKKNPEKNLEKYLENSTMNTFPALDFMQNKKKYEVLNRGSFNKEVRVVRDKLSQISSPNVQSEKAKYGLNNFYNNNFESLQAVYINPAKVDQNEFESIVKCGKQIETPQILIYGNPQMNQDNYYRLGIFDKMLCSNNLLLYIQNDGTIVSNFQSSKKYNYPANRLYVGYFDLNGSFIREEKVDEEFVYPQVKDDRYSSELKEVGFDQAYQESQTLKLLFDQNQQPINDYLQTCRNSENQTLFDIFKES